MVVVTVVAVKREDAMFFATLAMVRREVGSGRKEKKEKTTVVGEWQ